MKGKTILILGAGNVGEACAILLTEFQPSKIILHSLTEEDALRAKNNVLKLGDFSNITVEPSFGNVLTTNSLIGNVSGDISSELKDGLFSYLYSPFSDKVVSNSSLYNLLKEKKPDYIIDCINTSTMVGSKRDIYQAPLEYLQQKTASTGIVEDLLSTAIIPYLVRFVQVLHKYLAENSNVEYVKVSTTGLGGMGMNIKYTHGDINETGLSSGILGKIAAAGVMHQLLWNLTHTPGIKVKVVVPASLIGWQGAYFNKFRSNGKLCMNNTKVRKINLDEKDVCIDLEDKPALDGNYFMIPFADSGENDSYSLAEMTAITAQGQMEAITREEVAMAVVECLTGSTKYDLMSAMDMASLKSTYSGALQRTIILEKLKKLQMENNTPSIATNNLGPSVTKHLFELYFVLEAGDFNLKSIVSFSIEEILGKVNKLIIDRKEVLNQILSLGLPVLQENNILTFGDKLIYPKNIREERMTKEKIDKWASVGWVDLRKKQLEYWVRLLKLMYNELNHKGQKLVNVERNIHKMNGVENLGEVLAYLYSISGGNRRK